MFDYYCHALTGYIQATFITSNENQLQFSAKHVSFYFSKILSLLSILPVPILCKPYFCAHILDVLNGVNDCLTNLFTDQFSLILTVIGKAVTLASKQDTVTVPLIWNHYIVIFVLKSEVCFYILTYILIYDQCNTKIK